MFCKKSIYNVLHSIRMSKFVLIWSGHMNKKLYSALVSMMLCVLLMLSFSFSAVALDDKYNIDEL